MDLRSIVAIVNRKGGSGKSTTTFQLAGALLERAPRILIVDLDPQASLTRLLLEEPVEEGYGIGSCIVLDGRPAADILRSTAIGVDLLPGDRSIERRPRSYGATLRPFAASAGSCRRCQITTRCCSTRRRPSNSPPRSRWSPRSGRSSPR